MRDGSWSAPLVMGRSLAASPDGSRDQTQTDPRALSPRKLSAKSGEAGRSPTHGMVIGGESTARTIPESGEGTGDLTFFPDLEGPRVTTTRAATSSPRSMLRRLTTVLARPRNAVEDRFSGPDQLHEDPRRAILLGDKACEGGGGGGPISPPNHRKLRQLTTVLGVPLNDAVEDRFWGSNQLHEDPRRAQLLVGVE